MAEPGPELKVFRFEGVAPTNENVSNGTYKLTRPLLLIVKGRRAPGWKRRTLSSHIQVSSAIFQGEVIPARFGRVY
jgi:hypothetical protein